ncbi:MAG: DUF3237 domain-containing protein [Solirubrobacterales bacterium]
MSAATETSTIASTPLLERPALSELPVEHLVDLRVDLEPAKLIGTPTGALMVFIAQGGSFEGPRLSGEVVPGGGDWLRVGDDQLGRVDVRAMLRTHDGVLIDYSARGVIKIPADGLERLAAGERLPFEETYVRTTPKFETSDARYAWLNELVIVGHNELSQNHIDYRMYRVL